MLRQRWFNSTWENYSLFSYTYDANSNLIETKQQNWTGSTWFNVWLFSYIYDGNNNRTELLQQNWDGLYNVWVSYLMHSYTYIPVTEVNEDLSSVNYYSLSNNYPNPFNPSTKITYTIPERSNVSLKVFDLLGSEVAELVNGEIEKGTYDINFNAPQLSSGIYFYKLQAGSFIQTRKMILLK